MIEVEITINWGHFWCILTRMILVPFPRFQVSPPMCFQIQLLAPSQRFAVCTCNITSTMCLNLLLLNCLEERWLKSAFITFFVRCSLLVMNLTSESSSSFVKVDKYISHKMFLKTVKFVELKFLEIFHYSTKYNTQ